ncbi:MAG: hypothetical protein LBS21_10140 [Clostridiales bacterium]|jgi:hypothetical protein|nr:hypothetical protein [Clostridiales bacterium]
MKIKATFKLIITNVLIIAADSAAALTLTGNSLAGENPIIRAVCYTALVMSVILFFMLNHSFLKVLVDKPVKVSSKPTLPDDVNYRRALSKYKLLIPGFASQISQAYDQLDAIDQKRENLKEILRRNKSDCPDLLATCDETDDIITQNVRAILNRLTIISGVDKASPHAKGLYAKHAEEIGSILEKNYGILASFDDFLTYAAGMKDKIIEEDVGLKASITALKSLY